MSQNKIKEKLFLITNSKRFLFLKWVVIATVHWMCNITWEWHSRYARLVPRPCLRNNVFFNLGGASLSKKQEQEYHNINNKNVWRALLRDNKLLVRLFRFRKTGGTDLGAKVSYVGDSGHEWYFYSILFVACICRKKKKRFQSCRWTPSININSLVWCSYFGIITCVHKFLHF